LCVHDGDNVDLFSNGMKSRWCVDTDKPWIDDG